MSDEIVIEKLKAQFPEGVLGVQEFRGETTLRQAQDTAVTVRAEELVDVCTFLRDDPELQYTTLLFVTGLDRSELGAEHIVDYVSRTLGIEIGQTIPDGKFTLLTVECLGFCGTGPIMQVDGTYYQNLTEEKIDQVLADLA